MALSTGAMIALSSIASAGIGAASARQSDKSVTGASAAGIAEQRRQFDKILELTAPGRNVGNQALNVLARLFIPGFGGGGSPTGGAADTGSNFFGSGSRGGHNPLAGILSNVPRFGGIGEDGNSLAGIFSAAGIRPEFARVPGQPFISNPQGGRFQTGPGGGVTIDNETGQPVALENELSEIFRNLPGSQFLINEAETGVGSSFASRGGAFGGNAVAALGERMGGLAESQVINRLLQLAGFGPQATTTAADAASSTGANIGSLLSNIGLSGARRAESTGASLNNALQGGLNNFLLMRFLNEGAAT